MKIILIIIGCLSLLLGLLGIALPLLPTTPFLLLSAALFVRSSPRLYEWLINNRVLGEYIINYRENRSIPLRAKLSSITLVWASLLYCIFAVVNHLLWLQITLFALALAISWHLLSLNTTPRKRGK